MGGVCKKWRYFIQSKEFIVVRKLVGMLKEWLYVLTTDAEGNESRLEVFDCMGNKHQLLRPMPGPEKVGFGVVVLDGKLLVMAGYSVVDGTGYASSDVYQYSSYLNSWSKLANMNVARYDFACAEVNGMVYAVGGYGIDGNSLSSAEVYNSDTDNWTLIVFPVQGGAALPVELKESFMSWVEGQASQLVIQGSAMSTALTNTLGVR